MKLLTSLVKAWVSAPAVSTDVAAQDRVAELEQALQLTRTALDAATRENEDLLAERERAAEQIRAEFTEAFQEIDTALQVLKDESGKWRVQAGLHHDRFLSERRIAVYRLGRVTELMDEVRVKDQTITELQLKLQQAVTS